MRPITFSILLSSLVLSANEDAKADCSGSTTNWIEVRLDAPAVGEEPAAYRRLQVKVIEYLQAEYAPQAIEVCASRWEGAAPELAILRIGWAARNVAIVQAWANDGMAQKELSRRLSLEGLPPDAHAMAIAVGASELLGASWIELGLDARSKRREEIHSPSHHEFPAAEGQLSVSFGLGDVFRWFEAVRSRRSSGVQVDARR